MAPRTAKTKKATEIKVTENGAPKIRGKAKNMEEIEPEIIEELSQDIIAKKKQTGKRVKKAVETNGAIEETAPVAKKGRKKNTEPVVNGNHKEDSPPETKIQNGDSKENDSENTKSVPEEKNKKKQTKIAEKKTGKGKKNAKQNEEDMEEKEEEELVKELPKVALKGKGSKAQAKADPKVNENGIEDKPVPPPAKGRKKAVPKVDKQKKEEESVSKEAAEDSEPEEEKIAAAKKEPKSKKTTSKKKTTTKKDDKGKGDVKEEEEPKANSDDDAVEAKATKGKRGKKLAENNQDAKDLGEPETKRRRKPAEDKVPAEDKKKAPLKNKSSTNYDDIDFSNNSKNSQGKEWNFKISSWNVDGIRAWMTKGGLEYFKHEKPDIICLQEVKCSKEKFPEEIANLPGYHAYWACSEKDGYAGVGIYTTKLAMNVQYGLQNEEFDNEGRIITAEYEEFYLICTYVPNAGRKLVTLDKRLKWNEEFRKHVKELEEKKPVIICGDMNVAHNEIDLSNPKTNRKNAGFTPEECAGMTDLLGDGYVDTYRKLYPDKTGAYSFWTYMMNARSRNVGWRLDYFIASERLMPAICDSVIRDQVYGSDHCPITLFLHLTSAEKPKE